MSSWQQLRWLSRSQSGCLYGAWCQTHTECFTQDWNADTRNWQREAESRPKRPRHARPGVLQGVQDLIAELVAKGYRIVYTDGSSKRLSHRDTRRAGGFGVFATEDEQGPEVRFCGTDASQANKQQCGAPGNTGSPTGVLGAKIGNPHRLTVSATGSDRQGIALEIKMVDDNIRQAASPRARLGNAAPGNGKARKRSQVGTRPSTCQRAGE